MARIFLIVVGMASVFLGTVVFIQMSNAERDGKAMRAAIASGKARKTKAVVVSVWETTSKSGRHAKSYVTLKVDGVEVVRRLAPWLKSWVKVGTQVTVYGFEGRYHVQNIEAFGDHTSGKRVALVLMGWPPVVLLCLAVRSWVRRRPRQGGTGAAGRAD